MGASAKKKIASQLIQEIADFPPLPDVVQAILQASSDPESSVADLHSLVEEDISLSSSVIKLANSPFFGLSREVSSLPRALTVVGMEEVQNLVIANAMFQPFKEFNSKKDRLETLWDHSFRCALTAKLLAPRFCLSSSECFIAGQLHDLGKILVIMAFSNQSLAKIYPEGVAISSHVTSEQELLGVTHDILGARLVRNWLFPEKLCMAVGNHHRPEKATSHHEFCHVVWLADTFTHLADEEPGSASSQALIELLLSKTAVQRSAGFGMDMTPFLVDELLHDIMEVHDSFK